METSQLVFTANQLTGFYMRATLALNGLSLVINKEHCVKYQNFHIRNLGEIKVYYAVVF